MSDKLTIQVDDPRVDHERDLLITHLQFSRSATPREHSYALDGEQLMEPGITLFSARRAGVAIAIAALKRLDESHAELKSMHTLEAERRNGVGTAMVEHLLAFAGQEGYKQISLEIGATDEFRPARALYAKLGFRPCAPFGDYRASPYNTFMTISLGELDDDE